MTEENKEPEVGSGEVQGLAETPFLGFQGAEGGQVVDENAAPEVETPVETEQVAVETPEEAVVEEQAVAPPPVEPSAKPKTKEEGAGQVDYSDTFRTLQVGDVVDGVVVHIDKDGVLVDVGTKSEGIVHMHELAREAFNSPDDVVKVGDHIDVYVMRSEGDEDHLLLSKKRADFEKAWSRVEEANKDGRTLHAMVSDRVRGGLVVDLGIRGFVPGSHVGSGKLKNLDKFVGQSLPLKVIEVDRERRKVVLSHRLATEEDRESQRAETLTTLKEGDIRDGVVRRMTDYGAFIDLGGIDGLLHISEMSWTRINHPSEMLKVGDHIQVMVLKLNLDQGRVSLGLRQILPDPWLEVARKYKVGDIIKGAVTRLVPFGAFIQVEGGIEGIIPNAELAVRRVSKPEDVVAVGEEVEARVVDMRIEERRMTLSIRNLQAQHEREQVSTYTANVKAEQRTTVGDLFGDVLSAAARRGEFGREQEEKTETEQEITKPKPKKRASKAEQRAQEAEASVVDMDEELPVTEPEAVVETPAEPIVEAEAEAEAVVEETTAPVAEVEAAPEPEVPAVDSQPAAEENPAKE